MRDRHRKDSLEYYNLERKCKAEMDRINKLLKTLNREVKSKLHQPDQESDRLKSEITVVKDEIAEQVTFFYEKFYVKINVNFYVKHM